MSLAASLSRSMFSGFPRVSGDEPQAGLVASQTGLFSPRERG